MLRVVHIFHGDLTQPWKLLEPVLRRVMVTCPHALLLDATRGRIWIHSAAACSTKDPVWPLVAQACAAAKAAGCFLLTIEPASFPGFYQLRFATAWRRDERHRGQDLPRRRRDDPGPRPHQGAHRGGPPRLEVVAKKAP